MHETPSIVICVWQIWINLSRSSFRRDCCVHQHSVCFIFEVVRIVEFVLVLFYGSTHFASAVVFYTFDSMEFRIG